MKQKLIVFSADAMVHEDIAFLSNLPNFKKYLAGGSEIKSLRSIYPTVTFPVHVSLETGMYPGHHGIISNLEIHPGLLHQRWNWMHQRVRRRDIYDAAKEAGLATGSAYWSVTGAHPSIDYLINEYWTQSPGESIREAFSRIGTKDEMIAIMEKYQTEDFENRIPDWGNFIVNCACEIIRNYSPDLMTIHVPNLDKLRHHYGVFNEKVTRGIEVIDGYIGQVMEAAEAAGVGTNLFLLSDHGQLEIKRNININVLFADYGLIRTDDQGNFIDWDAYSCSNGMSALVFLKTPGDFRMYEKVYAILRSFCDEGIYGIGNVFTEPEIREREGLGGDFSFVLETDGYTSFGDDWRRPLVKSMDLSDYRYGNATHGYLPDKGPQPVLIAKGPAVTNGVILERRRVIDVAPTIAKLLGLEFKGADGTSIDEIIN
jgi:predicted AlkP superfamily pyrophosphatase or phosphodiesterase